MEHSEAESTVVIQRGDSKTTFHTKTVVMLPASAQEILPKGGLQPEQEPLQASVASSSKPLSRHKTASSDVAPTDLDDAAGPPTPAISRDRVLFEYASGAEGENERLTAFLEAGGCSTLQWDADALGQFASELSKGEATLEYDADGRAKRVVSVAKPIIYSDGSLLVEAFQSFESGKTKVKCTGMSEKFNPVQESCQIACVRAVHEELKIAVKTKDFCSNPVICKVQAASSKFVGLASEYHLYYCALHDGVCSEFMAGSLPADQMTAVQELDSSTNPKTLWWSWCIHAAPTEIEARLAEMAAKTPFGSALNFGKKLKSGTAGEQIVEELDMAKNVISKGLSFGE